MSRKFRYIIVVGFCITSASDMAGISTGKPPAWHTPRLISSTRCLKWVWQGLMSDQVLMIAMTGLPAESLRSYPICAVRERWPNERRSFTQNQRWLRRSSGFLRLVKLGSRFLDHARPFRLLGAQPLAEELRRAGAHLGALLREALLHLRSLEDLVQFGIELRHRLLRSPGGSDDALERAGLEAGQSLLGHRGRVRGARHATRA